MARAPKVAVIILNWNGVSDTIECLRSLECVDYSNLMLVLVDNGSEGDDVSILRELFGHRISIVENDRNYGFAEGCNIGIRFARQRGAQYLFLLNNDTIVADPALITTLVLTAESDSRVGVVGPEVRFYANPTEVQSGFEDIKRGYDPLGLQQKRIFGLDATRDSHREPRRMLWVLGTALLIRADVIDHVGLFDPVYFCYEEEVDFCLRVWASGSTVIYNPRVSILHKDGGSSPEDPTVFKSYYEHRNIIILHAKFLSPTKLFCFLAWRLLITLPMSILRCKDVSIVRRMLSGTVDGIRAIPKARLTRRAC